ncbi:hypothetical protein ACH47X_26175 [Promicromonospora kroppenstedtii]|uniref:Uncharacterized protein n=1 Tax=Promicromonospora kroppenstedtii TaxID=440482 RepID=A0ABW7XT64_9MICO
MASTHLGRAEQVDLGLARLAAGGALTLVQLVGALPGAAFLAASLGLPVDRPSMAAVLSGVALLVVSWGTWAWYRRRWTRAWELRKAWSLAIHDEAVLALPAEQVAPGAERDPDTDPESVHPFRAVRQFPVAERPFVPSVYGSYGHTYRVRGREELRGWLYSVLLLGLVVLVVLSAGLRDAGGTPLLLVSVVLLPTVAGAWYRYVRRMRFAHRMALTETRDRQRWIGESMLSEAAASGTGRTSTPIETTGPRAPDEEPLIVPLRVLPSQPPVTGGTVIPPGRWTLALSYDDQHVSLTPSDPAERRRDLVVTGLISGVHPGVLGGRTPWYWLVLADGTHVPVKCPPTRALTAAAEFAGIEVASPRMVV